MSLIEKIAAKLSLKPAQVAATVELLDAENTVPFIARYRKEVTGGLDEEQIRKIEELFKQLRLLGERRQTVLNTIKAQGSLTKELEKQINAVESRTDLEDVYRPYKPKRKTRASVARQHGLQSLANEMLKQEHSDETPKKSAAKFVNETVPDEETALAGARDIVAETISDKAEIRKETRQKALQWGTGRTEKSKNAQDPRGVYESYYEFDVGVGRLRPHQILAINRAEKEKVLKVEIDVPERDWRDAIENHFRVERRSPFSTQLEQAIDDAAARLLLPAIERDVRRELTEQAESHAIDVFATNLRNLLSQPPLSGHVVLGIDPGYRTGCKVAIVDPTGKPLDTATIYPHEPQKQWKTTLDLLDKLIERYQVTLIAIGNGTASRETEQLVAEFIQNSSITIHYLIVNEAGASVYSASKLARQELPDMDVSMRGAVSIARRLQDPLAELVKIDPKSIGVGMYQHDVDQKGLAETLQIVVESVVNQVGVEVNTASPALLSHVSGIGAKLAENIVNFRDKNGPFYSREALNNVPGMGPKTFEQAAGFLRVRDGKEALDASAIHPESYTIAHAVIEQSGLKLDASPEEREATLNGFRDQVPIKKLAESLSVGIPTLEDIFEQLIRPGRDPREDLSKPILRSDVLKIEDLTIGMQLRGTVRNVVDFGAFIDIGVKQDGLLHRSQIPKSVKLSVGEVIAVVIRKVEIDRGRISLGYSASQTKSS